MSAPAPLMAMKANNNEYRAPSVRLNPSILDAVIVIPERLVPGISASICARPMKIASFIVIFSIVRVFSNFLSAHHRIMPNINVAHAMTYIVFSQSGSNACNIKPAAMTGTELMSMNVRSFALCVVLLPVPMSFRPISMASASRQKYTNTAMSVPTWTAISRARFSSSHFSH